VSAESIKARHAALISDSLALNQTPAEAHELRVHALRGVPVYFPAFAGTNNFTAW